MRTDRLKFALHPRQVEAFRAVVLTGSMTAAAEYLGVTQPAISRLVRDFEHAVGLELFQRQGGHLVPTPEALALNTEVERFFVGLEKIAQSAADIRAFRAGHLRLAATSAMSTKYLPQVIGGFLADGLTVSITLQSVPSLMICDLVARHQVDLGIGVGLREYPGVIWEKLPGLEAVCVLPARHPLVGRGVVRHEDLHGERLVVRSAGSQLRARVDTLLAAKGIRYTSLIECNLASAICAFVAQGFGLAVVDPFTANDFKADGLACLAFRPAVPYECALVFPAHRPRSQLAEAFGGLLKENIRQTFPPSA